MFARLQTTEISTFEIVGVPALGSDEEISLAPPRKTAIVAGSRNQDALTLLVDGDARALHLYLTRAAHRFADRRPDAPTIRTVRLYRNRWEAAPQQSPPARRVARDLVAEIQLAGEPRRGR